MGNQLISTIPADELAKWEAKRPYAEYPKWLYHTDGRSVLVETEADETALGHDGDWHPNPTLALAEKAKRDEASSPGAKKAK